jgi:hypothetical protein
VDLERAATVTAWVRASVCPTLGHAALNLPVAWDLAVTSRVSPTAASGPASAERQARACVSSPFSHRLRSGNVGKSHVWGWWGHKTQPDDVDSKDSLDTCFAGPEPAGACQL